MYLARIIQTKEDDLICDLAETYNIYDYHSWPAFKIAVLTFGLRDNARIKLDNQFTLDTLFLAGCVDRLSLLLWQNTRDGQKNTNRPTSVVEQLLGKQVKSNVLSFESSEDFKKTKEKILRGGENG